MTKPTQVRGHFENDPFVLPDRSGSDNLSTACLSSSVRTPGIQCFLSTVEAQAGQGTDGTSGESTSGVCGRHHHRQQQDHRGTDDHPDHVEVLAVTSLASKPADHVPGGDRSRRCRFRRRPPRPLRAGPRPRRGDHAEAATGSQQDPRWRPRPSRRSSPGTKMTITSEIAKR